MAVNKVHLKYLENSINNATPEELVLMLYNGLVRYLLQAQKEIDEKNLEKAHHSITYADDIIIEFQVTLDIKYEISNNLMLLYDYMHRRLVEADVKKDKQILGEVLKMATELRDTWAQAMKNAKEQSVAQQSISK